MAILIFANIVILLTDNRVFATIDYMKERMGQEEQRYQYPEKGGASDQRCCEGACGCAEDGQCSCGGDCQCRQTGLSTS